MKQQDKDPLDKLFESLAEPSAQTPSAAYLQDVEARLDALGQKHRKPFAIWWIWSAFGAILSIGILAYWPSEASTSMASKPQKMERKTSSLNSSKPNSFKSLNISNPTSPLNISSLSTPFNISLLPAVGASVTDFYSIEAPSLQISVQSDTSASSTIEKTDHQEVLETSAPITPPNPLKKYTHLVGLQFGVSGIFSSFEVGEVFVGAEPYTQNELREWRELGERQTSSWDFNLRYQVHFGKWGLQTGLNYLEWGEQYSYKVISVEGTNRYQYVQIPLGLSYQVALGKVMLQPALGLGLGYGVRRDGAYILPNNNGVAVVESKKFATNAYAQLEWVYKVNTQLQFSVAPIFRYSIGQIIEDKQIINRYQSVGLLTGFSFTF